MGEKEIIDKGPWGIKYIRLSDNALMFFCSFCKRHLDIYDKHAPDCKHPYFKHEGGKK